VTALLDSQQNIVARYLYDPFGNLLARSGALADANRYRFSSKEVHPLSGLYDYGFRFYDPNLQRWLNADPLGEAGGINLHRFVYNSPINWVDTDGLQPANIAVPPRVSPRPSPAQGVINEEILDALRHNRLYVPTTEELFYLRSQREAWERQLRQRYPGHREGDAYLEAVRPPIRPPTTQPPQPAQCPPSSLVSRNAPKDIVVGTQVLRNWGGESGPSGQSWTRALYVQQSRETLGLETVNTAEFLSIGRLISTEGVTARPARPWGRFQGGEDEVLVPNALRQIRLDAVIMPDEPLPFYPRPNR
jgi:RHS repeat-associated protein